MTPPTPPAPHAQTLRNQATIQHAYAPAMRAGAAALDELAALRAQADAPDGTRAALEKLETMAGRLLANHQQGYVPTLNQLKIMHDVAKAALAASPAPARSLADQLDDDYCSPAPSDDGGPR